MEAIDTFRLYQSNPTNDNQTCSQEEDPFKSVLNYLARRKAAVLRSDHPLVSKTDEFAARQIDQQPLG